MFLHTDCGKLLKKESANYFKMSQTSCLNKCNMFWEMFCYFRSPELLEIWSISDSTLSVAAHFSANSLTHQSYLEVSGSHQLHFWLNFLIFYNFFLDKLQGNKSFWSKDGLDTREVPSRAKKSSACQGLARGPWISRNHFRYHHWHI